MTNEWIKTEDRFPMTEMAVIAFLQISNKKTRRIRAFYAPKETVVATSDEHEFSVYCEAKDEYYLPNGWYENNYFDPMNYLVDGVVTHWMMLPEAPRL